MDTSLWVVILGVLVVAVAASVGPDLLSPLVADFRILNPESELRAPAAVSFQDISRGRVIRRLWDFGDGSTGDQISPVSHTYCFDSSEPQTFRVRLTVWGRFGRSSTAERKIIIRPATPPNIVAVTSAPPRSEWAALPPLTTLKLAVDAEQVDSPAIFITSYNWTLTRRAGGVQLSRIGREAEFQIVRSGIYDLVITVENSACRRTSQQFEIRVIDPGPADVKSLSVEPARSEYYPVRLTASWTATHRYDPGPLRFSIDWGDGTAPEFGDFLLQDSRSHLYERAGRFTIKLRVFSEKLGQDATLAEKMQEVAILNPVQFMMPAWSPASVSVDGRSVFNRIAFVYRDDNRPAYYEIRIGTLRFEGGELREDFEHEPYFTASTEGRATNLFPSWSPDGKKLVIMSDLGGQRQGASDLYIITGKEVSSQLTELGGATGVAGFPCWALSGDIFFCSNEKRIPDAKPTFEIPGTGSYIEELRRQVVPPVRVYGPLDIYRVSPGSAGATQIVSAVGYSSLWPAADPTGKRIAFVQQGDIYVASTDGLNKDMGVIARTGWPEEYPRWNPKFADWIAFVRYKDNRYQVAVYNLKTKEEAVLTPRVPSDVMYPAWSPDGRYLIAQVKKPEGWRLSIWAVLDAQGNLLTARPEIALRPVAKK